MDFKEFGKIPRLNRNCTVTEKIDGTNGVIHIEPEISAAGWILAHYDGKCLLAGSRTRWLNPKEDNFGFAKWAQDNAEELVAKLGLGTHYGEWWGRGIQRGYGLTERRFSLFNTARWQAPNRPSCCDVVPVLYQGPFRSIDVDLAMIELRAVGSVAAPGFMDPEGIVVYHHAANSLFKATIKGDEEGKHAEAHPKKERPPKQPRDPATGGRRKVQIEIAFADRRKK